MIRQALQGPEGEPEEIQVEIWEGVSRQEWKETARRCLGAVLEGTPSA